MDDGDRGKAGGFFKALEFASVGLEMGASVGIGALFGWWLDGKFGTKPWLLLVFLLFGVAAGFRALIRTARKASKQLSSSNPVEAGMSAETDQKQETQQPQDAKDETKKEHGSEGPRQD